MSEAVTALNGAVAEGSIRVEDAGLQGMITLRGDLAALAAAGVAVPEAGNAEAVWATAAFGCRRMNFCYSVPMERLRRKSLH